MNWYQIRENICSSYVRFCSAIGTTCKLLCILLNEKWTETEFIGKNKINEWNGEHQNIRTRTTDILPLQTERNARLKWKTNNAHTHNRDGKYIGLENFVFAQHFCNSILLHGFVIQYSVLTEVSCTLYANNNQSSMCLCVCRFQSGLAYIHTTIQI